MPSFSLRILRVIALGFQFIFAFNSDAYTTNQLLTQRLDPSQEYLTLATEHFLIHYPATLEVVARRIETLCEPIYKKVTHELRSGEVGTTHLVLSDHSDESSIFTMVHPDRQIFMDVSLPQMAMGLNEFGDWHEWVLTHEFTHIVDLEMRTGAYQPLSSVFGSWVRPHLTMPVWQKEGLAVWTESKLTTKGRGTGSEYPMMFRMAEAEGLLAHSDFVHEDTIFTLENKAWPWGHRPYLFGYALIDTVSKNGEDAIPALLKSDASAFPYHFQTGIKAAGFSGFDELWEKTLVGIKEKARSELKSIKRNPLTSLEYLSSQGHYFYGLRLSPDGKKLYVTRDHPDYENTILSFDLGPESWSGPSPVIERSTGYQISVSHSNRFLAFDQTLRSKRHYLLSDIYIYDLKTQKIVGGTQNERARDPDIHPDGKHLVYVINSNGKNRLIENDTSFSSPIDLLGDVGYSRLSSPRYSPDGKWIALTAHHPSDGGEDLWLHDPSSNKTVVLLSNSHLNTSPSWTPDGKGLLFSSDVSGVSNIYYLELQSKKITRLSNVEGGLFYPIVDHENRWIYAVSYRGMGYDVARFRSNIERIATPRFASEPKPFQNYPAVKGLSEAANLPLSRSTPYQGTRYLKPRYLVPNVMLRPGNSQFGFSMGSVDPLYFQHYSLDIRYDRRANLPVGSLYYFNGTSPLAFDLTLSHDVTLISGGNPFLRTFYGEAGLSLPFSEDENHFFLHPFLIYQSSEFVGHFKSFGLGTELRYDTTFKQIGHSFPERGSRLTLGAKQLVSINSNAGNPSTLNLNLASHAALPWPRHAVHLNLDGATFIGSKTGENNFFTIGGQPSFPYSTNSNFVFSGGGLAAAQTRSLALMTGLYTFSIKDIERGLGTSPFYFGRLSGGVKLQAAAIDEKARSGMGIPIGAGLEVYQTLVFGTLFEFTAQLGAYRTSPAVGSQSQILFLLKNEN
jgi:Tol biopolymer transport system component